MPLDLPPAPVRQADSSDDLALVTDLVSRMTLAEKIGQLRQIDAAAAATEPAIIEAVRRGEVGSIINLVDFEQVRRMQAAARQDSRLGIPLLVARDVIHGFRTIFPIPLGQAASWNPDLVRTAARISALEAAAAGVNWTFSPMLDVSRDARWGRIAESFGEDPYLTALFGVAMVTGYQGDRLSAPGSIAACAKHFVGYGASEGGRDYNTTNIPTNELNNVYLPPFQAAVAAGAASVMSSFSDLDGVPATANKALLRGVLRDKWGFDGVLISDWNAIQELVVHGYSGTDREAALAAVQAGVDIEMNGPAYAGSLEALLDDGLIEMAQIDDMVRRVLALKLSLGLFEDGGDPPSPEVGSGADRLEVCRELARQSVVLLKNEHQILPLRRDNLTSIAVLGPLADAPAEQLGTWVFDGEPADSVTPLQALRDVAAGRFEVRFLPVLANSRDRDTSRLDEARALVMASDIALVCLGEDAILSGEAHSRARIDLPGAQRALLEAVRETGKPVIAIILAGRPLALTEILPLVDGLLFAWHPGTLAGPALADLLFGDASPSGRLPVTFPRSVGQIPIHYNRKNTGRPPTPDTVLLIDEIPADARQTSFGMTAFYLDDGHTPLFPFGFGLTYGEIAYGPVALSSDLLDRSASLTVTASVTNHGHHAATETAQLYVRDLVGSLTRPIRDLRGFRRVMLQPGETRQVSFQITAHDLAFHTAEGRLEAEDGLFDVWIGPDAESGTPARFRLQSRHRPT